LTITERFSEFNSYNAHNDVIDDKKIKLANLQFYKMFCHCAENISCSFQDSKPYGNGVRGRVGPPLIT